MVHQTENVINCNTSKIEMWFNFYIEPTRRFKIIERFFFWTLFTMEEDLHVHNFVHFRFRLNTCSHRQVNHYIKQIVKQFGPINLPIYGRASMNVRHSCVRRDQSSVHTCTSIITKRGNLVYK